MTALLLLAAGAVAAGIALVYVARRERHRARVRVLEETARLFGVEPMLELGNSLGWIERQQETDNGVRVKVRR